jgi:hypothetical protein
MTGFTTSVFLSRNRVSLKEAFEGLDLCEGKPSRTVLRGLDGSNPVRLLGHPPIVQKINHQPAYIGEMFGFAHSYLSATMGSTFAAWRAGM